MSVMPEKLEAKYGLPEKVVFCKKCVISNQRPNAVAEHTHTKDSKKTTINFDAEGVCDACRLAEKKKGTIDWEARDKELRALCAKYRKADGSYDCLVPGSGGKDSFYTAHILKYKYGMHPLTVTWAPHIYTDWGWVNMQAWIHAGFDNILFTPNGKVHRLLTRLATDNLYHPFQPFILGQKSLAPKLAARHDIKLIFYGEHEAEYGNPIADTEKSKQDWAYFTTSDPANIYFGGASVKDLTEKYGVDKNDLNAYLPVDPDILVKKDIVVHYLGYYLKWHPQGNYYYAVEHGNFQAAPERTEGTYSKYNSIDDKVDDFYYYTTYIKFGIGRATYDAAQEVRSGDITRAEAVSLVKRFDGEFPTRFASDIYRYLTIDEKSFPEAYKQFAHPAMDHEYFMELADKFRSPHLWKKADGEWRLRHTVFEK